MDDKPKPLVKLYFNPGGPEVSKLVCGNYLASSLGDLYEQIQARIMDSGNNNAKEMYEEAHYFLYNDSSCSKTSEDAFVVINGKLVDGSGKHWDLESKLKDGDSVGIFVLVSDG